MLIQPSFLKALWRPRFYRPDLEVITERCFLLVCLLLLLFFTLHNLFFFLNMRVRVRVRGLCKWAMNVQHIGKSKILHVSLAASAPWTALHIHQRHHSISVVLLLNEQKKTKHEFYNMNRYKNIAVTTIMQPLHNKYTITRKIKKINTYRKRLNIFPRPTWESEETQAVLYNISTITRTITEFWFERSFVHRFGWISYAHKIG